MFEIFQQVSALGYADDLKLFMTIKSVEDCRTGFRVIWTAAGMVLSKKIRIERCKMQVDFF
jgi:hypothetical protein